MERKFGCRMIMVHISPRGVWANMNVPAIQRAEILRDREVEANVAVSDQRHALRDRRSITAACPACWAMGAKK
jgi:hypothetical protein